ncbi:putative GNAT family acetyltransferase [Bacillus sp. SORGH_AS 510]|uniref:GNAT family N-acetyltransferase n=1 Tax=Bacillus sp. SORGH_AS_0510 TaxID=3041771 RepID=UPI00278919B7|nr:GNAT family N-acetyltransferase [Bacillus sp. SORGH_AS_0510]MDQ1147637.1 putative GNAT family acetyltransferase [Bacillus sp. SORGH_AS_0510]
MFIRLVPNDDLLTTEESFVSDEVQYNLIHRISEGSDALGIKTPDNKMILAQSPGHNAWLWLSKETPPEEQRALINNLVDYLNSDQLPGVSGDPQTAEMFAEAFSKKRGIGYQTDMTMESYHCPKVLKPVNVSGEIQKAALEDIETVEAYLAGFLKDAFGTSVEVGTQMSKAQTMIGTGNLYLWFVDGKPVSMANISHRSPRHARINAVFTPVEHRKNGYASALVRELCVIIHSEGLIPMLYADIINPDSNKVYKNIGFIESGKIAEIKFVR